MTSIYVIIDKSDENAVKQVFTASSDMDACRSFSALAHHPSVPIQDLELHLLSVVPEHFFDEASCPLAIGSEISDLFMAGRIAPNGCILPEVKHEDQN